MNRKTVWLTASAAWLFPLSVLAQTAPGDKTFTSLAKTLQDSYAAGIFALIIMFLGFFALRGRLNWAWPVSVFIAMILVMRGPQIVELFLTWLA